MSNGQGFTNQQNKGVSSFRAPTRTKSKWIGNGKRSLSRDTSWGSSQIFHRSVETNHGRQMGLINNSKWVQIGISKSSTIFRNPGSVVNANNQAILNLEIESLLQKAVIEPVPFAQWLQGFYSTFFLVQKMYGDLRAVINLRPSISNLKLNISRWILWRLF